MADKTPIARVSAIQGQAFVKEANGSLRPLHIGDTIYEGDVIVTVGQRSHVDLATPDGLTHVLRGNETLTADAESVAAIKADATDSALTAGATDVNRVIQTINQGGDLDALLEETAAGAPAAGAAGAGADGGPSFVRLLRVAEGTDPLAFEYGTTRSNTLDEGIVGAGTTPVAATAVTASPSLTVNAPTSNDTTPTLSGTTDAPVGST
ncbi:MAG TPA: retention module-containing protein, partial [Accumulibacter sp.]|nr:retention module-containing protein [Accumulibacter sp.]